MRTVYVLTHGAYSDYGVICVFENREDADEYCSALGGDNEYDDGYRVEEYTSYGPGERPNRVTVWDARVNISLDGTAAKPLVTKRVVGEDNYERTGDPFPSADFLDIREWVASDLIAYGVDIHVSTVRGEDVALKALWDRVAVVQARLAGIG